MKPSLALVVLLAGAARAAGPGSWKVDTFFEHTTHQRANVGLSKARSVLQVEARRELDDIAGFSELSFATKLRGSYDGVFDINDRRFGDRAGGPIELGDAGRLVPHGGGVQRFNSAGVLAANPNDGMVVLGSAFHGEEGGLAFGVPVRPCDKDRRGCIPGYLDFSETDLQSPEFARRLDFIREFHISAVRPLESGNSFFLKLGRQQVVWGRTDLFRVLDVINPVDYSRNNIYDELQNIRIPMLIALGEYRMGAAGPFDDLNASLVWNFDKFRPHNIGQGGSPNVLSDSGSFFRGMKNIWDNGGTIANIGAPGFPDRAVTYGPNQIGIRQAHLPPWTFANTQYGGKLEGTLSGVGFSLNGLSYRSQFPVLHGGIPSQHPVTGVVGIYPYSTAFDIYFPRVYLGGGSLDFYADSIKSVFRVETAFTTGEEFSNTLREQAFSMSRVSRYVVGWDRPTFIPWLNSRKTFLLSAQVYGQYLWDYQLDDGPLGSRGMPDWKWNHIVTGLVKGSYKNDRLSPQLLLAHDVNAQATALAPSVEWLATDALRFTFGGSAKLGHGARKFADARTSSPYTNPATPSLGRQGFEPLGRFRAGPIGQAIREDELQASVRYKF